MPKRTVQYTVLNIAIFRFQIQNHICQVCGKDFRNVEFSIYHKLLRRRNGKPNNTTEATIAIIASPKLNPVARNPKRLNNMNPPIKLSKGCSLFNIPIAFKKLPTLLFWKR